MRRLLALIGALLAGLATLGASAAASAQTVPTQAQRSELLLVAVQFEGVTLTEAMTAYGDPADPLVPIGELSRMFELDVQVQPASRRVTGRASQSDGRC